MAEYVFIPNQKVAKYEPYKWVGEQVGSALTNTVNELWAIEQGLISLCQQISNQYKLSPSKWAIFLRDWKPKYEAITKCKAVFVKEVDEYSCLILEIPSLISFLNTSYPVACKDLPNYSWADAMGKFRGYKTRWETMQDTMKKSKEEFDKEKPFWEKWEKLIKWAGGLTIAGFALYAAAKIAPIFYKRGKRETEG